MLFGMLVFAAVLGCIPAAIAQSKGRSFLAWWFYGWMLFIVALIHALVLKPDRAAIDQQASAEGLRKCPSCAEMVRAEAKVCRFCQRDLPSPAAA